MEHRSATYEAKDGPMLAEMQSQIHWLRNFLDENAGKVATVDPCLGPEALRERFGFRNRGEGRPELILGNHLAAELGYPRAVSHSILLTTYRDNLVRPCAVHCLGPDIDRLPEEETYHNFVQIVLLQLDPRRVVEPYALEQALLLVHRLPGVMVRSVPGRVWLRFGRDAVERGMNLSVFGSALHAALVEDFPAVVACESVFITSGHAEVEALRVLAAEAEILRGRHRKLSLGEDGEAECRELNCDTCEEKPVCDNLREIRIKRRRTRS